MIVVCEKHVNRGLKMIFLPHVQPIPKELSGNFKCQICSQKADFKLFNFVSQRKQNVYKAMLI